jgi:hypothetical protein
MGLKRGAFGNTLGKLIWELELNMLGTNEKRKKKPSLLLPPPSPPKLKRKKINAL